MSAAERIRILEKLNADTGTPTGFEDAAILAAQNGMFKEAAELYERAAGVTLGHNRATRYQQAAQHFAEKAKGEAA